MSQIAPKWVQSHETTSSTLNYFKHTEVSERQVMYTTNSRRVVTRCNQLTNNLNKGLIKWEAASDDSICAHDDLRQTHPYNIVKVA